MRHGPRARRALQTAKPGTCTLKLRGKFILAFLFCGLSPLLLSSVFTHYIAARALDRVVAAARATLEESAKDRLRALIEAKEAQLEDFISTMRSEALTFASVRLLEISIANMGPGFEEYRKSHNHSDEDIARMREDLQKYYEDEFKPEFMKQNEGKEPPIDDYIEGLSANTIAIQHRFFIERDIPEDKGPPPGVDPLAPLEEGPSSGPHAGRGPRPMPRDYASSFGLLDSLLSQAKDRLGYYDLLLVDSDSGTIIYSAERGIDFGANLKSGPLASTGLGACYRAVLASDSPESVVFSDFSPYLPAYGQASSFLGVPIYRQNKRVGAVIFRLNLDHLNRIMGARAGLYDHGAMLLIGPDYLLRSDLPDDKTGRWNVRSAFLRPDNSKISFDTPNGEILQGVFSQGRSGSELLKDFRDNEKVLTAYAPLDILGARWALVAMIRADEAFHSIGRMQDTVDTFTEGMKRTNDVLANIAIVALCVVAYVFARRIARPLGNTVELLKDIAAGEGDRTRRLAVYGRDEVGELALAFNEFMDKLEGVYQRLQREVSERKLAQIEIQNREAYFKALIENAPDVIMIVNPDFSTSYVSPSYERTFGFTLEELVSKPPLEFIHPEEHALLMEKMQETIDHPGVPYVVEFRALRKDGGWRWVQAFGSNQLNDGVVNGVVINMRDITDRRHAEQIMRDYNVTLEREVAERTLELQRKTDDLAKALHNLNATQDQLILNEKMASLGALTAGIAHEIKNPLNFVNNFADVSGELVHELSAEIKKLREAPATADFAEIEELLGDIEGNVKKILEHGRRADSIVRSMLLHSRGVSGQRGQTDINKLLDEYVHLTYHGMRAQDNTFNIEFDLHYDETIGQIEVVPQDISRVFLNILNNACYAAGERTRQKAPGYKPVLTVRTKDLGDSVEIRIRDNGTGIPEEIQRDVFNPFFTTKPAGKGTGLGLSISYDIVVKEHHGELSYESKPGEYTEFVIVLPKKMVAETA